MTPLAVGQSGDYSDSSATRFGIAGGAGTYAVVTRGCQGEVLSKYKRDFRDAAASVEHEFRGPLVLGLRSQRVSAPNYLGKSVDYFLWNPHVGLEWKDFGMGVGIVTPHGEISGSPDDFFISPFSAHLRLGDRSRYLSFRVMESEPYFSSGGVFEIRAGARFSSAVQGWLGIASPNPSDAPGLIAGTEIRLAPGLQMNAGGRLGGSEGINESAVHAGLSYTWTHRRYDFRPDTPPDSAGPVALTLTLDGGTTVDAVSVQPWSMGYVRVVLVDGQISFISTARIRSIVDAQGVNLTKKVLSERRRVP